MIKNNLKYFIILFLSFLQLDRITNFRYFKNLIKNNELKVR